METLVKINIAEMKDGIKKAAEIQKFYKNQRKTVHILPYCRGHFARIAERMQSWQN